jgi:hypothetical protein
VKKLVSKFAFRIQPAALHRGGRATQAVGKAAELHQRLAGDAGRGRALHVGIKLTHNP